MQRLTVKREKNINFAQLFKKEKDRMDKVSYALGLGIGSQLADMGARDLNIDDFASAIKDMLNGK